MVFQQVRKLYSLFGGLGVFGGGLLLLILASFLKMQQLDQITSSFVNQTGSTPFDVSGNPVALAGDSSAHNFTGRTSRAVDREVLLQKSSIPATTSPKTVQETILQYASLPGVVFVSIIGFAAIDMGFDVTISLSRALILENVPSFQHMRVLVLATVVQSSAGTTCSLIGCFDLPGILGPTFKVDGTAATLIFFCCVLLFASINGFFLMSLASYRLGKKKKTSGLSSTSSLVPTYMSSSHISGASCSFAADVTNSVDMNSEKVRSQYNRQRDMKRKVPMGSQEQLAEDRPYIPDILHTEEGDTSTRPFLLEDSLKANYSAMNGASVPTVFENELERCQLRPQKSYHMAESNTPCGSVNVSSDKENNAVTSISSPLRAAIQFKTLDTTGVATVLNVIRQSYSMSMSQRHGLGDFHARKLTQLHAVQSRLSARERDGALRRLKIRLTVLCVSTFFTIGSSISMSVYSSNTLNLGILHGDPTALPGTEGRDSYEKGLQLGAIGNLIMYSSFMAVSLGNNKIIDAIGERGQFALFHALFLVALLTIICTKLVEVYFVFMVFCGAYRTCMLTLPFVLAHKFTQEGARIPSLILPWEWD
ncbi:hypothetical protein ElyMa_000271300 [Elysia marginata]|uniref:Amino acid transporter n=1 Tax=Elysia marginata TaxID=1093978 RepID=A0AAV4F4M2_9GAST|nr:hypothetical protein ElyMa_000271300 [Elysia marginata]